MAAPGRRLDAAQRVLLPRMDELRAHVKAQWGMDLDDLEIHVTPTARRLPRTFAACAEDGSTILLAPDLAREPVDVRDGIMMHELGHAIDFRYGPRDVRAWQRRSGDRIERDADEIANEVFGVTIGYRGPCLLQSTLGGSARPRGLR